MSPNRLRRFEVRRGADADGEVVALGVEFVTATGPGSAAVLDVEAEQPMPVVFASATDVLFMHDGCSLAWLDE